MTPGKVVAEGHKGPVYWAIHAQGPALDLFSPSDRNRMVREAMVVAGKEWGATFLPKRFSHYIDRAPFPYPRHRDGFYLNKARRMGILQPIFRRLFGGWDPWSSDKPGLELIADWKKKNPGKYRFSVTGLQGGLIADLRKNAKRMIFEIVREMNSDDKFIPLVESGYLRKQILTNVQYRATATSNKQTLRITMPFGLRPGQESGKGGHNATVGAVLGTIPGWEVRWYAKRLGANIAMRLRNRGYSMSFGQVVQRAAPDYQSEQNARAFQSAMPRGFDFAQARA